MKDQNKIKYSIIIPHKNIPELLRRCLRSIPIRDDVQIIVVDDNSDPDKIDFSNLPELNRPNTEVYMTKGGQGAGYARNIGLIKAKGKWLVFADADDFFNDCLGDMFEKYKETTADLIFFQTNSVDSETLKPIKSRGEKYNTWIRESDKSGIILEDIKYRLYSPWGKFFSHELIKAHNIKFDVVFSSNDVMFSTLSGHTANRILIDMNYLYCSTIRKGSLENSSTIEHIQPRFYVALRQYNFLLSVHKAKYRMNIWYFILQLRKLDKKWISNYLLYCTKEMKFTHLTQDFLKHLINYLKTKLTSKNII
ncbi:hypothetical protein SDC9_113858 [bioreactor metagenome]|uniref:Glycosyltransferase 2-like domain-containing protein n=1 Tax=bioreactor metagenome TaxID=1076179 RepID=A0A645BZ04_9ZZZZ